MSENIKPKLIFKLELHYLHEDERADPDNIYSGSTMKELLEKIVFNFLPSTFFELDGFCLYVVYKLVFDNVTYESVDTFNKLDEEHPDFNVFNKLIKYNFMDEGYSEYKKEVVLTEKYKQLLKLEKEEIKERRLKLQKEQEEKEKAEYDRLKKKFEDKS